MAIRKINSGYETKTTHLETRMLEYFPEDYDYFFEQPLCGTNDYANKNTYITDEKVEKELDVLFATEKNLLSILVGYHGMGKSTILKNYFSVHSSDELSIKNNKIIFSKFNWNYNYLKENAYNLGHIIHNINSRLCSLFQIQFENEEDAFFEFLLKKDQDLISIDCAIKQSIQELKRNNNEIYEIRRFEFILDKVRIKSFCFVIDNIESLKSERRFCLISKLVECFRLLTENTSNHTIIKMLFSFRPDTLYEAQEYGCFQNKEIGLYIKQIHTINLEKYFSLKLKNYNRQNSNFKTWNKCLPLFMKVSQKYNRKYDHIIKKLCNYSVPAAMKIYSNILSNSRWMHDKGPDDCKKSDSPDYFNIDDIVINNITVIRAISCLEDEMFVPKDQTYSINIYDNKKRDYSSPICNLLYSTPNDDYSILILYIIKFFYNFCKKDNLYGTIYLKHWDIIRIFTEIFGGINGLEKKISTCISYLFNMQILDKSIKTKEDENSGLSHESRLYLTPKGEILWEMLSWDSVLLEIFREDYYRDYSKETCNNPYCSYILMQTGQQYEIFKDLIRMINCLLKKEKVYRDKAKENDTFTSLRENFGKKCICAQLFEGVKQSMMYSGIIKNSEISDDFYKLQGSIENIDL